MDTNQRSEWVDSKLAALTPMWQPELQRARTRVAAKQHAASARPRRVTIAAAIAASAMGIVMLTAPASRAVAQRVWDSLFLHNVTVLRVDSDALPWNLSIHAAPKQTSDVATLSAAAQLAGFAPLLPAGHPKLAVIGAINADVNLDTAKLHEALARAGIQDIRVPGEWNGAKLGIHISPSIVAVYPGDITLMQLRPVTVNAAAGFAMEQFAEMAFRIVGVGEGEARRMAVQFTANPSWFLAIPQDEEVKIRETSLRSGRGMLIQDYDADTRALTTALIWSTPDRTFLLSGKMSEEQAIAMANNTPTH